VIWGSDWPNVAMFDAWQVSETGVQLDRLRAHIGDEVQLRRFWSTIRQISSDTPARLPKRLNEERLF
jgi:hypothetical protein